MPAYKLKVDVSVFTYSIGFVLKFRFNYRHTGLNLVVF